MRDSSDHKLGYHVAIVTLDAHAAGPADRVAERLAPVFPGLRVTLHAAAQWGETPDALEEAREAVAEADIVITSLLFIEEHIRAILPSLEARRERLRCDDRHHLCAGDRGSDPHG